MTDPLDSSLRQLMHEVAEKAPSPHSWHDVTARRRRSHDHSEYRRRGLIVAIAAVSALAGIIIVVAVALHSSPSGHRVTIGSDPVAESQAAASATPATTSITTTAQPSPTSPRATPGHSDTPSTVPVFGVQDGNAQVAVAARSYCFEQVCADGIASDPATFHVFPASDHLTVTTPQQWPLTAQFTPHGQSCAPSQTVTPEETAAGVFRIDPVGPAGTYDLTLFAQDRHGTQSSGDAATSIVWTSTDDGPPATPTALMSLLTQNNDTTTSYGGELTVTNLTTRPTTASATLVVTSAQGTAITLDLIPAKPGPNGCPFGTTGSLQFQLDAAAGQRAAALGSGPYRYDVTLTLDTVAYTAHAAWPTDQIADNPPNVPLQFNPPLPA